MWYLPDWWRGAAFLRWRWWRCPRVEPVPSRGRAVTAAARGRGGGPGRTRWDAMSETVEGGWRTTVRLAVLLLVRNGPADAVEGVG